MNFVNLTFFEKEAGKRLSSEVADFFAGGAEDEITVCRNVEDWQKVSLLQRVLTGAKNVFTQSRLLGNNLEMPLLVAPTAFHRLAHPDGEIGVAKAACLAGVTHIISMAGTTALEDIVDAVNPLEKEASFWFQIYLQEDRNITEHFVRRAEKSGCKALVVTVDSPVFGRRERDITNGFHQLPNGLTLANFKHPDLPSTATLDFFDGLSWKDIEWLKQNTDLPVVLKGIMHWQDAVIAEEMGIDGIIVSNHGGRQLDGAPSTISVLPKIAAHVKQMPLIIDGGVRRGTDIIKALALGASAVAIGRPVLWGLVVDGQFGVTEVFSMMKNELHTAMALCGIQSIEDISSDIIF